MNIINSVIRSLGKENYNIDPALHGKDILIIICSKFMALIRGFLQKPFLKKSEGILFVGKNCSIKYAHKISFGKTVTLGPNVEINAMSIHGIKFGNNVSVQRNTLIECTGVIRALGEGLTIGNNVGISPNCFIQVRGKVDIGSNVMIGPYVCILSENHITTSVEMPMITQGESRKGILIKDDVWIGAGAKILDGVIIGKGCVIAAGAVVNKNVEDYTIVGGVPAKVLKSRVL
jgi:acetyltransferase-like isoleucine patch superfamily enzyme